jgi:hypothetical protein
VVCVGDTATLPLVGNPTPTIVFAVRFLICAEPGSAVPGTHDHDNVDCCGGTTIGGDAMNVQSFTIATMVLVLWFPDVSVTK